MSLDSSRAFWDAKAAENPYWYVSSYGSYAKRDLAEFWQAGRRIWQDLRHEIGYTPRPDDVVVEVGCGIGRLTRGIAADVAHVHAFDISQAMLALARLAGPVNATFHQSQGDSLAGMPSGTADLAVAYCVFQHLPSLDVLARYVTEMRRVLKPGGTLAFTLSPRTWGDRLRPVLRAKRWLREQLLRSGPRGLYQPEWIGIRPGRDTVLALSPVPLAFAPLHGDKWLFWGRVADAEPQSTARVAANASRATSRADRAQAAGLGAS
jgi:SAM-dependent methyltransferase